MSLSPLTRLAESTLLCAFYTDSIQVPHPLFPKFELHVRTDGEITPKEALLGTCRDLVQDLGQLSKEFTKEYELRKLAGGAQNGH